MMFSRYYSTAIILYWCTWLFIILAVISSSSQESCTQGFMDYELLSQKALQIGDSSSTDTVNGIGSNNGGRTYVMPGLRFTCSGTITGLLLAADIRIDGSNRVKYPRVFLYDEVDSNGVYNRVLEPNPLDRIILGPDDFSTSGLYNYTLPSPLQYTSGQILGVRQSRPDDSIVRLYYRQSYGTDNILRITNGAVATETNQGSYPDSKLLLFPITDNPSCLSSGFISYEDLQESARLVTSVNESCLGKNVFFPDINFTCNGSITHVIVGLMKDSTASNPPAIQIWRRNMSTCINNYTQSGPTIPLNYNDAVSDISTDYLRLYNLSVPVPVQEGDVLGIYHAIPTDTLSDAVIYYQEYSGPVNYAGDTGEPTGFNFYPLVSVVVSAVYVPNTHNTAIMESSVSFSSTKSFADKVTLIDLISTSTAQTLYTNIINGQHVVSTSGGIGFNIISSAAEITATSAVVSSSFTSSSITIIATVSVVGVIGSICFVFLVTCIACTLYIRKNRRNDSTAVKQQGELDGDQDLKGNRDSEFIKNTSNESYGIFDKTTQEDMYDCIDSNDGYSDAVTVKMKMNESYGEHKLQNPMYIEGKKQHNSLLIESSCGKHQLHNPIEDGRKHINSLPSIKMNESYGKHQPVYIEGKPEPVYTSYQHSTENSYRY